MYQRPGLTRRQFVPIAIASAMLPQIARGHQEASPTSNMGARTGPLVTADRLAEARDASGNPPVIVAFMAEKDVANGVIPGSVRIDWPDLETADTSPDGLAAWTSELDRHLTALGITPASRVAMYDPGTLFAARLWWLMHAVGHREIEMLDGGLAAWVDAGFETTATVAPATPAGTAYGASLQPGIIAPIAEVEAAVGAAGVTFVDARSPQEWEDGHIPGAVNIPYTENAVPESPRTWRTQPDLEALYASIPRENRVIPYCSSGVRSAVTAFTLHLIGYPDVGLFTGSWNEWITDPSRPVTTGNQP